MSSNQPPSSLQRVPKASCEPLAARDPAPERSQLATSALARLDSRALFGAQRELLIDHGADCYRLRWTRSGKLILTK